jgi:hypothetical protein
VGGGEVRAGRRDLGALHRFGGEGGVEDVRGNRDQPATRTMKSDIKYQNSTNWRALRPRPVSLAPTVKKGQKCDLDSKKFTSENLIKTK